MSERARLLQRAQDLGFSVEFRDWCEDSQTPGFPGQIGGKCSQKQRLIVVSTKKNLAGDPRSGAEINAILSHELEHAEGAEKGTDYPEHGLKCGGQYHV